RAIKRAAWMGGLGAVTFIAFFLLTRVGGPKPIPQAALAAASDAGCGDVQTPAASAPGGIHLSPGQSHTYSEHPATSGPHDPSPLPGDPHVYDAPGPGHAPPEIGAQLARQAPDAAHVIVPRSNVARVAPFFSVATSLVGNQNFPFGPLFFR